MTGSFVYTTSPNAEGPFVVRQTRVQVVERLRDVDAYNGFPVRLTCEDGRTVDIQPDAIVAVEDRP